MGSSKRIPPAGANAAKPTVARQRAIQQRVDAKDRASAKPPARKAAAAKKPVQAGPRRQPKQMPEQHLRKPGNEHELELALGQVELLRDFMDPHAFLVQP